MVLRNWSGTVEFGAADYAEPVSIAEVQRLVAAGGRIRALGTRHSFNPIADTDGTLVTTTSIPPEFTLDPEAGIVTTGTGTRYAQLASWLTEQGWALHNMGSLPHISVGGAIATGTHGSGDRNGNLSTAVVGLQIVGDDGELRWIRRGDADFAGSVVALGALGVVVRLELTVQPSYLIRQDVYRELEWDVFLADVPAMTGAAYSVSVFTDWVSPTIGPIWVKQRVTDAEALAPDLLAGARRDARPRQQIIESSDDNTTPHGVVGPWSAHLPHFRIDSTPSAGDEIQTEYFVDRADAAAAIAAVRTLRADIAPHLLITELRTIAADDLWLSPAYERDSIAIHFTWQNHPAAVEELVTRIEAVLDPFAPRPHWGKVHTVPPATIRSRYPMFEDFRALVARTDPTGRWSGPYLDALLGDRGAAAETASEEGE